MSALSATHAKNYSVQNCLCNKNPRILCLLRKTGANDTNIRMANNFHPQSAIILGMHDAIVSLLGLIAGLYFAFTDTDIIVISCIIASITAALSMSAANYLATRAENHNYALWAGFCTGAAYLATAAALILPFIIFQHQTVAIVLVFAIAILIIYLFNLVFYHGRRFYRHFFEMLAICTIVSAVAFLIGEIANHLFGI